MRILILSQWFDPEPTFKGMQFAKALRAMGHEVSVLTGFPNYPGGKVYPGYAVRGYQREIMDGVRVLRAPLYPSHNSSGVGRAANYLSFAFSSSLLALFVRRPDVVYVYHPPATAALAAMVLKALKGAPFVYDIQDMWPDTLSATGMVSNPKVLGGVSAAMRQIYRQAAHIVVLSHGFRQLLIERGVPGTKVTTIPNWTYEHDKAESHDTETEAASGEFTVVYAGNMGPAQALDTALDAAKLLLETAPHIRLLLVGNGLEQERLQTRVLAENISNVSFGARRSTSEIETLLARADALLVHLKDDPLFTITIPSKIQAYLRMGRPILAGVRGDAARIIEDAGVGIVFPPQDADAMADAIGRMAALAAAERSALGQAGATYYKQHLSLEVGAAHFARIFDQARYAMRPAYVLKRLLDLAVSAVALVILSLPLLMLTVLVAVFIGRPVLFRQDRPGRYGKVFSIFKFRTMTNARDAAGALLPDAQRLTAFGSLLRTTSLDELPALLNVLRGDMSLVGPRPLLTRYTEYFTEEERLRLVIRPGITGWAQVNGRNLASWDRRLAMDVWYVRNWSLWFDLKILALTALRVVRRQNVVIDPESVMQNLDDERRDRQMT